jgi:hypothetical protein
MEDEYTDAMFNPADLLKVKGYRVYGTLSNLYRDSIGKDAALNGSGAQGAHSGDATSSLLLGDRVAPHCCRANYGCIFTDGSCGKRSKK